MMLRVSLPARSVASLAYHGVLCASMSAKPVGMGAVGMGATLTSGHAAGAAGSVRGSSAVVCALATPTPALLPAPLLACTGKAPPLALECEAFVTSSAATSAATSRRTHAAAASMSIARLGAWAAGSLALEARLPPFRARPLVSAWLELSSSSSSSASSLGVAPSDGISTADCRSPIDPEGRGREDSRMGGRDASTYPC